MSAWSHWSMRSRESVRPSRELQGLDLSDRLGLNVRIARTGPSSRTALIGHVLTASDETMKVWGSGLPAPESELSENEIRSFLGLTDAIRERPLSRIC